MWLNFNAAAAEEHWSEDQTLPDGSAQLESESNPTSFDTSTHDNVTRREPVQQQTETLTTGPTTTPLSNSADMEIDNSIHPQ